MAVSFLIMTETSKMIYMIEEYFYENTNISIKSLVNTIYGLDDLEFFFTKEHCLVISDEDRKQDIMTIYEAIIDEMKWTDRIKLHFKAGHKLIRLEVKVVNRCAINLINSTVCIKKFKEEIK